MSDRSICSIRDCKEPKCAESRYWCRRHFLEFRVAGMADQKEALPNYARNSQFQRTFNASIRRRIKPYDDDKR